MIQIRVIKQQRNNHPALANLQLVRLQSKINSFLRHKSLNLRQRGEDYVLGPYNCNSRNN